MIPVSNPTILEIISNFKKPAFWYGGFFLASITSAVFLGFISLDSKYEALKHELEISKLTSVIALANKELSDEKKATKELRHELNQIKKNSEALDERYQAIRKAISSHCSKQQQLVRTLQKDHKLQTDFAMNYEYLSILEKVLINMFDNANKCFNATN